MFFFNEHWTQFLLTLKWMSSTFTNHISFVLICVFIDKIAKVLKYICKQPLRVWAARAWPRRPPMHPLSKCLSESTSLMPDRTYAHWRISIFHWFILVFGRLYKFSKFQKNQIMLTVKTGVLFLIASVRQSGNFFGENFYFFLLFLTCVANLMIFG